MAWSLQRFPAVPGASEASCLPSWSAVALCTLLPSFYFSGEGLVAWYFRLKMTLPRCFSALILAFTSGVGMPVAEVGGFSRLSWSSLGLQGVQ